MVDYGNVTSITVYDFENLHSNQYKLGGYNLIQEAYVKTSNSVYYQNELYVFGVYNNITRQIQPYIFKCYIPCITSVAMSFSSFIIPVTAIPGRVTIIVTQFLTLTSIFIHRMVCKKHKDD